MVAYEFYGRDGKGKEYLIGILPERRKTPERISGKSIMNWVGKILAENEEIKCTYFLTVDV
jgi:hypothetical protein